MVGGRTEGARESRQTAFAFAEEEGHESSVLVRRLGIVGHSTKGFTDVLGFD